MIDVGSNKNTLTHEHAYVRDCTRTPTYAYTRTLGTYLDTHALAHTHTRTHMHAPTRTYTHTHARTHMCVFFCVWVRVGVIHVLY